MKQINDTESRLSVGAVFVMGLVIVVLHAAGAFAAGVKGACERDPDHTLQQLSEIYARMMTPPIIPSKAYVFSRLPKDIPFKRAHGTWRNTRPTSAFYLPVPKEEFIRFNISCPISCNYRIQPTCEVTTPAGVGMFTFRDDYRDLIYVLKDDFEPVPSERKTPRP